MKMIFTDPIRKLCYSTKRNAKICICGEKMKQFKIVVEKHPDTYVAYPLGIKGVVVGQGETYEAALADVKSAIKFHIDTFGADQIETDPQILEAFIAETGIAV
jgi:predicted RNase H-like HicB family nuclease